MAYWLFKSEPEAFSISQLESQKEAFWDGVRNYQARNYLRDSTAVSDWVLFYHSNANPSGIVGLSQITKPASPDPTQFDPSSPYFDPKALPSDPRWFGVTVGFRKVFAQFLPLAVLKEDPICRFMLVCQKGSRLSIQPVEREHYERVLILAGVLKSELPKLC